MKFSIERAALLRSLSHVQSVVERRTTIPILSNVKLAADGDELGLTATDLDLTLVASEPAQVERRGVTTAPAHLLFEIVRKLPDGAEIGFAQEPGAAELAVTAGRSAFNLPCLPPDEYPAVPAEELEVHFELGRDDLARLVDRTRFAVSTEETRYYLNGIHIHAKGSGADAVLRGVATDGHRLARIELPLPSGAERLPPVIVPRKTVNELRKLLDDGQDVVAVSVSTTRAQFGCGRTLLISRLIDGTFPDYERVIPVGNERIASLPTKSFQAAVDRVATISSEKARAVKLAFEDGKVTLSAVSAESGRATEELDCSFEGEPLEIGFNARYVLDVLQQVEGGEVRFEMANAAAPTVIRDGGDGSVLYVLMPMRV